MYFRLGKKTEAERDFAAVEEILREAPNPGMLRNLRALQAEMTLLFFDPPVARKGGSESASAYLPLALMQTLVSIRNGHGAEATRAAEALIEDLVKAKRVSATATAQLALGEALALTGASAEALRVVARALSFFQSRQVWESLYRSHLVVAACSREQASQERERIAARAAFDELNKAWTSQIVIIYSHRPDIRRLGEMAKL
jgi:hypothetical protein